MSRSDSTVLRSLREPKEPRAAQKLLVQVESRQEMLHPISPMGCLLDIAEAECRNQET